MEPRSPCTGLAADLAGLVAHPAACLPHGCTVSSPEPPPCLGFRSLSPHHAGSEPGGSGSWSSWLHWPSKGPWGRAGWGSPRPFCARSNTHREATLLLFPAMGRQGSTANTMPTHPGHTAASPQRVIRKQLSSEPSAPQRQRMSRQQTFPSDPAIGTGHMDFPASSARPRI